MTDKEMQSIILKFFYEQRREKRFFWTSDKLNQVQNDFGIEASDVFRICKDLCNEGFIEWRPVDGGQGIGRISAEGIYVFEEMNREDNDKTENLHSKGLEMSTHKNLFIIMPMAKEKPLYVDVNDTIKSVAAEHGIHAFRIDDDQSNERITDRILDSIDNARHIVADLTDSRPNVFFEAGYALGIGKIPVFIAAEGTKLEFDIKDYPIIFFKNQRELKEKLSSRLQSLISEPLKKTAAPSSNVLHNDENDIKAILAGWAQKKNTNNGLLETLYFNAIDEELQIPSGSSKAFLKDIIMKRWNCLIDVEGPNTIKFKYGPVRVHSRRILNPGFDIDKF